MAAVAIDSAQVGDLLITPAGREYVLRGRATADITKGRPVVIDGAAAQNARWQFSRKPAVAEIAVLGVAIKSAKAGETVEIMVQGEMTGYASLVPGALLSVVAGQFDTTAGTAAQFHLAVVLNPSTIYFRA